jgi:hypothetical protein
MEKPILFSTAMVQAILEDSKSMTRRVVKFPEGMTGRLPENGFESNEPFLFYHGGIKRPSYKTGDTLWVREKWCKLSKLDINDQVIEGTESYYYAADGYNPTPFNYFPDENGFNGDRGCPRWKPSIFMPRKAARLFLTVKCIRVERLQDISEEDARAEGMLPFLPKFPEGRQGYRTSFELLWNSLNDKRGYGWNQNPWVWVVEFERQQGGISK